MNLQELEQKYKEMSEEIERLKKEQRCKESEVWKPENGELYYFLCSDGITDCDRWSNHITDEKYYAIGNCYKTREEAENKVEQSKVLTEMQRFADENNGKFEDGFYKIVYDESIKDLDIYTNNCLMELGQIYFSSKEIADKARKLFGDRLLKYVFNIKEEQNNVK